MVVRTIVRGRARGRIMKTRQPINFLGAVDNKTGTIRDPSHELHGRSVRDSILVFPHGAGSSVGAYTIYSLKSAGAAPKAMICLKADPTVASGCALANIPLITMGQAELDAMQDGAEFFLG